ncbi:hypothetical protein M3J09_008015 [Ascochyta lentis]
MFLLSLVNNYAHRVSQTNSLANQSNLTTAASHKHPAVSMSSSYLVALFDLALKMQSAYQHSSLQDHFCIPYYCENAKHHSSYSLN